MKTDYTLTLDYAHACFMDKTRNLIKKSEQLDQRCSWESAYAEARRSNASGEPLIRTVCKIATRILFVLLVVGLLVGVLLK